MFVLEEVASHMQLHLQVVESQYDRTCWGLDPERLVYTVYCSGAYQVGKEHRAQLHQVLFHRLHLVGEASSHDAL
jgi:hypothetical protein